MINSTTVQEQFSGFLNVPEDLIHSLLLKLALGTLLQMGETCKTLKKLSEDQRHWIVFGKRLGLDQEYKPVKDEEMTKALIITRVQKFMTETKTPPDKLSDSMRDGSEVQMKAYLQLKCVGFNSLDKAFECAKKIVIRDIDLQNKDLTFYDKCDNLAHAYIRDRNFAKAEEILKNMTAGSTRSNIAYYLLEIYLNEDKLEEGLTALKYVEGFPLNDYWALNRFMVKAMRAKAIDIGIKALKQSTKFPNRDVCFAGFSRFLLTNGEGEKAQELQDFFSKLDKPKKNNGFPDIYYEVCYAIYDGQIQQVVTKFKESSVESQEVILHIIQNVLMDEFKRREEGERGYAEGSDLNCLVENFREEILKRCSEPSQQQEQ